MKTSRGTPIDQSRNGRRCERTCYYATLDTRPRYGDDATTYENDANSTTLQFAYIFDELQPLNTDIVLQQFMFTNFSAAQYLQYPSFEVR